MAIKDYSSLQNYIKRAKLINNEESSLKKREKKMKFDYKAQ